MALTVVFIETFIVRYCYKYSCLRQLFTNAYLWLKRWTKEMNWTSGIAFWSYSVSEAPNNVKKI